MPHTPSSATSTARLNNRFVRRLGPHHFAHLRAVAEGLDVGDCARRFLGIAHGHEARTAHQQAVDAVRAVARRRGETAWRLIGLSLQLKERPERPSLEHFVDERGLEGFSETDALELYEEVYPADRKTVRGQRLRERQLALLEKMQGLAAEHPLASDLVSGWFDDATATKLVAAGMVCLGDLNAKVSAGGRWYSALPAIGQAKARRIEGYLATLLARDVKPARLLFVLRATPALFSASTRSDQVVDPEKFDRGTPAQSLLQVRGDLEAVQAWIKARAGALDTAKVYQREASRLMLWLQYERQGSNLAQMSVNDCGDFMAFLQNIPASWISRERAKPGTVGWAPFRGPLSHASQRQAVTIIASLFTWLQAAQYLSSNPWLLVNQKTGDDRNQKMLDTKAFSESAMQEVIRFIDDQAPSASRARIRFILRFVEAVGLRSAELLQAKLGDLRMEQEGWVIQVHGKGAKNRVAAVPGQALEALKDYLQARHLGGMETAAPQVPLLASTKDPMVPIGYQALYEHVKGWLAKAVRASNLPAKERDQLAGATTHWLRHTFGTRAIARDVPLDVIQAQMGHASIQTTTAIYGRAPIRRRVDELGKAFGQGVFQKHVPSR